MAVVQTGGMRKASQAVHLSQPAVSKAMKELENALGLQLFERSRRGVEPTVFGKALAQRAKIVLDEMHGALRELDHLADPQRGEVKFGCTETLQAGLAAAATHQVLLQHPGTRFVMESGQAPDLVQHFLLERAVDFVLARPFSLPLPEGIAGEPLFCDHLQVVVGAASPFAKRRRIDLVELADEHWILSRNELMQESPMAEAFSLAGVGMPRRIVVSGSLNARYGLLRTGRFVTLMPNSLVRFGHHPTTVRILPIATPPWRIPNMILTLRGRAPSPAAQRFLVTLRELSAPLGSGS